MGQGAQSKALRIANMTQYGFDSQKIYDQQTGEAVGSVMPFDTAPTVWDRAGVGRLPGGAPMDWPDGYSMPGGPHGLDQPREPWNAPDHRREDSGKNTPPQHAGSDPYAGMNFSTPSMPRPRGLRGGSYGEGAAGADVSGDTPGLDGSTEPGA